MVVLLVGIPGLNPGSLPRTNGKLEFVAVASLAEALTFLDGRACDAVLLGADAPDMAADRLAALARRSASASEGHRGGSATVPSGSEAATGPRERGDVVDSTFRRGSIRDMERLMILDRLARLNQNRTRSAESLEISVRTLRNKLRDYRASGAILVGAESETG